MSAPDREPEDRSYVTEIGYPAADNGPLHYLFLPLSPPEPLPPPLPEPQLEAEP
jgi:hypothetical protein